MESTKVGVQERVRGHFRGWRVATTKKLLVLKYSDMSAMISRVLYLGGAGEYTAVSSPSGRLDVSTAKRLAA
jgi:hypothetical protein